MPYEFDQQDHGATWPQNVVTEDGTCTQCGRKGPVARIQLSGLGQVQNREPCVECFYDLASGTQVVPAEMIVETSGPVLSRVGWDSAAGEPVLTPLPDDPRQAEAEALVVELVAMAVNDPNVNNEDAHCWLSSEQRPRSVEIGRRLDELGGFDLMLLVHDTVRQELERWGKVDNVPSLVRGLEMAWDDIGEWRG